jgi:hypothetical protein
VIVYVVALCVLVGVPASTPVKASNVVPAGAEGEIAKLEIVPPEEETEYPTIEVLTVCVSAGREIEKAGAAIGVCV